MKTVAIKLFAFIRSQLTLERFNLFLQGTLLILSFLDGYTHLLLRRSAVAGLLTKRVEEWVFISSLACEVVFGTILAWYGRERRQRALSGWLFVTAVAAFLVLATPQPGVGVEPVQLCNGQPLTPSTMPSSPATGLWIRTTLLVLTAFLCALAKVSVWAHGVTYLDDHEPTSGVYFYGILISIRLSVGANAKNWFEAVAFREDWWKGQLSFACLTLMFSILFMLFPTKMPGKVCSDERGDNSYMKTMSRLLRNKVFIIQSLAFALVTSAVWGLINFEPQVVRTRFHFEQAAGWYDGRTARLTGDILRTFVIVYFVTIFRTRFSGRRAEGVKSTTAAKVAAVVAVLAAAMFVAIAVVSCDKGSVEGQGEGYVQPACSEQCGCRSEDYKFAPVCALDSLTTYYSPCHAGCNDYEDLNGYLLFENCTCSGEGRALQGACNVVSCQTFFSVFQILYVNAVAISAAALLMLGMSALRASSPGDAPVSLAVTLSVAAAVHCCWHVGYMYISDATCAYNHDTECLLHRDSFPTVIAGTSAGLIFIAAGLSALSFTLRKTEEYKLT